MCFLLQAYFDANIVDMEEFSTDPHTVAGDFLFYFSFFSKGL